MRKYLSELLAHIFGLDLDKGEEELGLGGLVSGDVERVFNPPVKPSNTRVSGDLTPQDYKGEDGQAIEMYRRMSEVPLMKEDVGRYLGCLDSEGLQGVLKILKEEKKDDAR